MASLGLAIKERSSSVIFLSSSDLIKTFFLATIEETAQPLILGGMLLLLKTLKMTILITLMTMITIHKLLTMTMTIVVDT